MAELPEFLTKKVAGLPGGVWIAIVGTGLGVIIYIEKKKSAGVTTPAATTGTASGGTVDASGMGSYQPAGDFAGTSGSSTSSNNTTYTDNNSWGVAAINYLVAHGYDVGTANQAITQYLASAQLTTTQQAMVNIAVAALGSPPTLVAPVNGSVPNIGSGSVAPNAAVGNLHVYAASSSSTNADVVWDTVPGATSYLITLTNPASGASAEWTTPDPGSSTPVTTSFNVGITPGVPETVTVYAVNAAGQGPGATTSVG